MATPTVTSLDVSTGPPGTLVVITGTGFDDDVSNVAFGIYSAGSNFIVVSETDIAAYVPAGTGAVNVSVTNGDGTSSETLTYTYASYEGGTGSVPVVSDIDPDTSAYDGGIGGDTVTITGTGFMTAVAVYFDEATADFTLDATTPDTKLYAIAPPGSGVVEVDVANIYGRSADPGSANNFTYTTFDVPSITAAISPQTGIAGTYVTITGASFLTANAVTFGGYGALFNPLSDTVIEAWAPYGPTAGAAQNVLVTNPAGTSPEPGTATWNDFTYWGVPTGLTVTPLANAVEITWDPVSVSLHASYRVYADASNPPTTIIATTAQTTLVYAVDHSLAYYYAVSYVDQYGNESAKCAAVGPISSLETIADVIADGAIDAMSMFASGIMPPQVLLATDYPTALPTLPDTDFPSGSTVFWEVDRRLYRNLGGGPHLNTDTDKATWYDREGTYDFNLGSNFDFTATSGWAGSGLGADAYALHFNGTSDWATCSTMPTFASDHSFTIEAWIRRDVLQSGYVICLTDNTPTTVRNYLALGVQYAGGYDRGVYAAYKDDTGTACSCYDLSASTYGSYDGLWHHICLTVDGATATTYLDGIQTRQKTDWTTGTFTVENFTIGRLEALSPSSYFAGDVAAVRCYSSALSAAQVAANVGQGPTGAAYLQTNLVLDLSAKYAKEGDAWLPVVDVGEASGLTTAGNLAANSILAGMLSVGSVGADEIAANSIASKHIFIGNFDNLITNPQSEQDQTGRDVSSTSPEYEFRGVTTTNPYSGTRCRGLIGVASGDTTMAITRLIPVLPGEKYYCECRARLGSAVGHGHLKLVCYKSDGTTEVSTSPARTDAITVATYPTDAIKVKDGSANPWYTIPGTAGSPADAGAYIQVFLETTDIGAANYLYVDCMFLRRMNEGSLIVDGAIDGMVITAPVIRTAASPAKRIELTADSVDKLRFYTGISNEATDGYGTLYVDGATDDYLSLMLSSPTIGTKNGHLDMRTQYDATNPYSRAQLYADDVVIGTGDYGDVFIPGSDGTKTKLSGSVSYGHSRLASVRRYWDFMGPLGVYGDNGSADEWLSENLAAGGATASLGTASEHHPGVISYQTAATANAGRRMTNGSQHIFITTATGTRDYAEFVFQLNSTSTNAHLRMGFANWWTAASAGAGNYGAYLWSSGTTISGKTVINGTVATTTTDTGALSADTWYTARIIFRKIALDYVGFYIFEEDGGDPVWYDTLSDLPTGAGMGHGFVFFTDDATARNVCTMDYMNYFLQPRTR